MINKCVKNLSDGGSVEILYDTDTQAFAALLMDEDGCETEMDEEGFSLMFGTGNLVRVISELSAA